MNWKIEEENSILQKEQKERELVWISDGGRISLPRHLVPLRLANHWEAWTGSRNWSYSSSFAVTSQWLGKFLSSLSGPGQRWNLAQDAAPHIWNFSGTNAEHFGCILSFENIFYMLCLEMQHLCRYMWPGRAAAFIHTSFECLVLEFKRAH